MNINRLIVNTGEQNMNISAHSRNIKLQIVDMYLTVGSHGTLYNGILDHRTAKDLLLKAETIASGLSSYLAKSPPGTIPPDTCEHSRTTAIGQTNWEWCLDCGSIRNGKTWIKPEKEGIEDQP